MNINQAKNLPLPEILNHLGHNPAKITKGGRELWYYSPFRAERDPSFHISIGNAGFWIWKDFAGGGGTVIDFILHYENLNDVSEALQFLDTVFDNVALDTVSKKNEATSTQEEKQFELLKAAPLTNIAILDYLKNERHIPYSIAQLYLKEIYYKNKKNGKPYFAFGMENINGGYEIRTASSEFVFKTALNGRDITLVKGSSSINGIVNIFEGMIDFLSFLVLTNCEVLTDDALIMHSLSSFQKAIFYIEKEGYKTIHTFLDNDPAGLEGTERYQIAFPNIVKPYNSMYAMYVDLNDALRDNNSLSSTKIGMFNY